VRQPVWVVNSEFSHIPELIWEQIWEFFQVPGHSSRVKPIYDDSDLDSLGSSAF